MKTAILILAATLGATNAQASDLNLSGEACTLGRLRQYVLGMDGACYAEMYSCVDGKLAILESAMPPAPGKCGEGEKSSQGDAEKTQE